MAANLAHFFSTFNLNYTEKFAYDYAIKTTVWAVSLTVISTIGNSLANKIRGKPSTKGLPLQHPTFTALDDIEYDIPYVELKRYLQKQSISQPILLQILFLLSSIGYFLAYLTYAVIPSILSSLGIIPIFLSFLLTIPISIGKACFLIFVTCPPELKNFIKARLKKKSYALMRKAYWQGRCVYKLYPFAFKLFASVLTLYTILIPLVTSGSCLAYYTPGYGTSFDAYTLSTQFSRFFTLEKACPAGRICHIYSTLAEDASRSMIINVHTGSDIDLLNVVYTKENGWIDEEEPRNKSSKGWFVDIEWKAQRYVHSIYLDNLEPNTGYYVQFFSNQRKYLGDTRFVTLPSNKMEANITLVTGGDSSGSSKTFKFMDYIVKENPNAIVIGGDIVYDNGNINCYYCWDYYLGLFGELNQKVGRLVPLILAVGNHDLGINSHQFRQIDKNENLFFRFFPQHTTNNNNTEPSRVPENKERMAYFYHVLGNTLHVTLDSGYLNKYAGKQTEWLNEISKKYQKYVKFAAYHNPIFSGCYFNPLEYGYDSRFFSWIPVFEKYNYMGIFENHVHLFKRTFPLSFTTKNKGPGVVYFGDGAWGVNENNCYYEDSNPNITGIFAKMGSINHIWIVKISASEVEYSAINLNGDIIDSYKQNIKDYIGGAPGSSKTKFLKKLKGYTGKSGGSSMASSSKEILKNLDSAFQNKSNSGNVR